MPHVSLEALARYSCVDRSLPPVEGVKSIVVIDFDNTLFKTPLPNRHVWDGQTIGLLQAEDAFSEGGWWHNPTILKQLGDGEEVEATRAWDGWWNEQIVTAARAAISDSSTLTVLLTGRRQDRFSDHINRVLASKNLVFDMVILKQPVTPGGHTVKSTADFKNKFFEACLEAYTNADTMAIFEDRPKQAEAFRQQIELLNDRWATETNGGKTRGPVQCQVVDVVPAVRGLEPLKEVDIVKKMMHGNSNAMLFGKAPPSCVPYFMESDYKYTGYLIPEADTARLLDLITLPEGSNKNDYRILADNIMISYQPPRSHEWDRAGGKGAHRRWRVTHLGSSDDSIYAARVEPVDSRLPVWTKSVPRMVILAHKKNVRVSAAQGISNWVAISQGSPQAIDFDSIVSDKVMLRLVEDRDADYPAKVNKIGRSQNDNFPNKRKFDAMQDRRSQPNQPMPAMDQSSADDSLGDDTAFPPLARAVQTNQSGPGQRRNRPGRQDRDRVQQGRVQGRNFSGGGGQAGRGRQGQGRGGRPGRGRGGQYRSLDDATGGVSLYGDAGGMNY